MMIDAFARYFRRASVWVAVLMACCFGPLPAVANPSGHKVTEGSATFNSSGSQLTITTSDQTFINWQSFNIGVGETTTFVQPSSSSLVWNQINDPNPSQILGTLNANGYVVLQNQNGFYIGGLAAITAHGVLMTTAPIPVPDLSGGGPWAFNAPPPSAKIINYGQIKLDPSAGPGGSIFLIANGIENYGTISANGGSIGLYAGQKVLVSDRPNGLGLSARVTLPSGSVDNAGNLIADAGVIAMHAQVVNQGGLVQADSVKNVNGVIELVASDSLTLGANSDIEAQGDTTSANTSASPGGFVVLRSGNSFADAASSTVNVAGSTGGRDGIVEVVGQNVAGAASVQSSIDGLSASQFSSTPGDVLLVNPNTITLSSGATAASSSNPNLNVADLSSFSKMDLFASGNITINTLWNLANSVDPIASLTLVAGNNIMLPVSAGLGNSLQAGNNWSVKLTAGTQLAAGALPVSGNDGIYLNGNSFIQTQNGNIDLWAANEVLINTGGSGVVGNNGIRTLAGGSISVTAFYGDVNTGGNAQGYNNIAIRAPYYNLLPTLGGISTMSGGDVTIQAGGNVTSFLPTASLSTVADAGSGAFGTQPGNVTITAGGSVFGHYVLGNGQGKITAGQNAGTASQNIALSLITGDWSVNAPNGNIYLQEVRNPSGVFVNRGTPALGGSHFFNYGLQDSVDLNAGIGVYLTCQNLPRPNDPVPVIFPPTLNITAGSGGVVLQDNVILFPSPYSDLNITTTAGGSFVGQPNNPAITQTPELTMSESSQTHWINSSTFTESDSSRATVPIELNNPNPVVINISGGMNNIALDASKQTQITVGGDMDNCSFTGQNLHGSDVTSINVAGQIFNRSPYSFIFLDQVIPSLPSQDTPPNSLSKWDTALSLALLNPTMLANVVVPANLTPSQYATYAYQIAGTVGGNKGFTYDQTTGRFGYKGEMPTSVLNALSGPLTVLRYGPDGFPMIDSSGHFVTDTVNWVSPAMIAELYQASLGAPPEEAASQSYTIGGPGQFDVHAGSISLGNSYGILSCGVADPIGNVLSGRYANLGFLNQPGATINVTVDGNLDMLTSTIASLGGGDVNVTSVGGSMDLGSQELFVSARPVAFGIYTAGRGNVNVTAQGDIQVDGSRIAAYNGGNVSVESLGGNVNAGSGGTAFVSVPYSYVDPLTGLGVLDHEQVFGSGIVAYTLVNPSKVPNAATLPGNILVQTPQGSIFASQGGIVQEALNGNVSGGPTVTLIAGTPASDTSPGYIGDIDLGNSGVIGGTVVLQANGNINGLVISRQNSTIDAAQNFNGTVLSGGTANLSAGGSIAGVVIGVGGVNASGGEGITATLLGQSVSVGGGQSQSTLGTSATATSASQAAAQQANSDTQQVANDKEDDDDTKKKGKGPALRRTGRVTVILPAKS